LKETIPEMGNISFLNEDLGKALPYDPDDKLINVGKEG